MQLVCASHAFSTDWGSSMWKALNVTTRRGGDYVLECGAPTCLPTPLHPELWEGLKGEATCPASGGARPCGLYASYSRMPPAKSAATAISPVVPITRNLPAHEHTPHEHRPHEHRPHEHRHTPKTLLIKLGIGDIVTLHSTLRVPAWRPPRRRITAYTTKI